MKTAAKSPASTVNRDHKLVLAARNGAGRLHSQVSGAGPDLVCVHGRGVSGSLWDPLTRRLAARLRIHAVDLPGHGRSPAGAVGLNNWTNAVLEVAPERSVLLGWSLGGLLCMQAAYRYPARVRGLILVDTLPRMLRGGGWQWGMKPAALAETVRGLRGDYISTLQEFLMLQVLGEPGARHLVRQMRNQLLSTPPVREALERGLDILHEADLRAALPEIDVPVLAINGERDRMCHPDGARWMADQLPNSQTWIVPRAAHAPFLSHEREFAERVAAFTEESQ